MTSDGGTTAERPTAPVEAPERLVLDWPTTLATERLTLRPVARPDVPHAVRLWTDPQVRRHLGGPVPADVVRARERHCVGVPGAFAVVRHDGEVLGLVVAEPDGHDGRTEVSYQLLPEHWGHGYAREAVHAVVAWAGQAIRSAIPGVVAVTQRANTRSRHLLDTLGATAADHFVAWGEPQVLYVFPTPGAESE
ncbi:GNAT family N-acetyltransferase [Streptomyces sp. NRRL B-1347]|uniref:GNAT family N-acetyltransferase n=1 Tax=Streptomyces sp. NRRL B-1347 TaxID=1476877 RepID=UPI00099D6641|nr:GNAT family N-acetyltransferase [Streptomyces sp. NRRL B-1347]